MASVGNDELAELKVANAALTAKLAARTAELDRRDREYSEVLAQQAASAEVLQVINESAGDLTPVFDSILEKAMRLGEAAFGSLFTYDGERFLTAVHRNVPAAYAQYREQTPPIPLPGSTFARALETRRTLQDLDVMASELYRTNPRTRAMVDLGGVRTILTVPLCKDDAVLGLITVYRQEVRAFSDRQIALVEGFAAQAVIAMENARLITETREALEQQTATAEVLQVINASPGDLRRVFETMLEKAMRLCDAAFGEFHTFDGDSFLPAALLGIPAAFAEFRLHTPPIYQAGTLAWRIREGAEVLHIADLMDEDAYRNGDPQRRAMVDLGGARSAISVALRKDDTLLGMINVYRQEVRPFSDRQVALLQSFAAQAVIAMENTRLITETREALEQQTATTEVLQVINASPANLEPVFEAMLDKALRLCGAAFGALRMFDGEALHQVASYNLPPRYAAYWDRPLRLDSTNTVLGAAVFERRTVQIEDMSANESYRAGSSLAVAGVELGGVRTLVHVPLIKDGVTLGVLTVFRQEVRLFSDRELGLLQNFAAQAVIAMENARLLTETREALEQQTATAEVLQVINASPGDLAPVFDSMLEKAMRLCSAAFGSFYIYDGEQFVCTAQRGLPPAFAAFRAETALRPIPGSRLARAMENRQTLHALDLMAEEPYRQGDPFVRAMVELGGVRTILTVPLCKDETLLGFVSVYRQEVKAFSNKQITLLENFAAQAVIAMENARLLTETREALGQQTATAEVLGVINSSPGDLMPVFDAILEKAHNLCHIAQGSLELYDGERFRAVAVRGMPQTFADMLRQGTPGLDNPATRPLIEGHRFSHIRDLAETDYSLTQSAVELAACRTLLCVPLRRDDALLGMIASARREVRPFLEKEITLLENFAAQAVIAMENARLLTELRQRTDELARRNSEFGERIEQQAATIDVLKVMSSSPGDPQPVFDLIAQRARAFCGADHISIELLDDKTLRLAAHASHSDAWMRQHQDSFPAPLDTASVMGRAIMTRASAQIADILNDAEYGRKELAAWARSTVAVPLLRGGMPIGAIGLGRATPGEFTATQMELLWTFAEQAVIAITSAETYRELQERTEALARRNSEYGERIDQQAATIDVLKAMSASSGDAQPVFQVIVERARAFCNADNANLTLLDGNMLHLQATTIASSASYSAQFPRPVDETSLFGRAILARDAVQTPEVSVDSEHFTRSGSIEGTARAIVAVPLLRAGLPIGAIGIGRHTPGEFSPTQIELLRTFADQAVIAISSAETSRALQDRTVALTQSVAELQALEEVLRAVNSSLELETVLSTIISRAVQLSDADEGTIYEFDQAEQVFVPKSAYGMTKERVAALRDRRIRIGETPLGISAATRAPLHIPDLAQTRDSDGVRILVADGIHALLAVPLLRDDKVLGGLVIRRRAVGGFAPTLPMLLETFAGQCVVAIENARLFHEARQARVEAEATLADLRRTQNRLVQSEKMASLGQLTAGIAHEIKNPLNFVNNFSELSVDLLNELHEVVAPDRLVLADNLRTEIDELTMTLKGNLEKIAEHGRRADSIVKNMLLHSRSGPGEHRLVDLNSMVGEALNLVFHGARAATPGFNIRMETRLDPQVGMVDIYPQEITRVLLNLISNGFYAAHKRAEAASNGGFEPTLELTTRDLGNVVEIRVRDNGTGISEAVRNRIFEPFFTTKPAGEGTGLGLSLSYEIVVQQHGGRLTVDSEPNAFTEFVITLPRTIVVTEGVSA